MKTTGKNMFRYLAFALALLCTSCAAHWPAANQDDFWVSSEPEIWFVGFDEEKGGAAGQVVSDNEVIDVRMCWGPGPQFDIRRYPASVDDLLVRGECDFSQNEGTVDVIEDKAGILGGVKTITFKRQKDQPTKR